VLQPSAGWVGERILRCLIPDRLETGLPCDECQALKNQIHSKVKMSAGGFVTKKPSFTGNAVEKESVSGRREEGWVHAGVL